MSREGWIHMELPVHQNEALKILKTRMRKRNMASVVEEILRVYDPDVLESGVRIAKEKGVYQAIENGDENGDGDS